ncbi:MAG: DUF4465 domain-containing protein [Alistipes sp.]
MKKLLLFTFAFAALALASCSDDNDAPQPTVDPPMASDAISFEASEHINDPSTGEDVVLGDLTIKNFDQSTTTYHHVFTGKTADMTKNFDQYLFGTANINVWFGSYYSSQYDAWGGIALSQNADNKAAAGSLAQQFSVWAKGGANATKTFAVCYDSNTPSESYPEFMSDYGYPTIDIIEPCVVDYLYIANSTYVYNYFTGKAGDSFKVKITGNLAKVETSSLTVTLVDGATKVSDWQKVDLKSLGKVDQLVFKVIANPITDPYFFCIDEIRLQPEK